jgi:hypothetical protein
LNTQNEENFQIFLVLPIFYSPTIIQKESIFDFFKKFSKKLQNKTLLFLQIRGKSMVKLVEKPIFRLIGKKIRKIIPKTKIFDFWSKADITFPI